MVVHASIFDAVFERSLNYLPEPPPASLSLHPSHFQSTSIALEILNFERCNDLQVTFRAEPRHFPDPRRIGPDVGSTLASWGRGARQ